MTTDQLFNSFCLEVSQAKADQIKDQLKEWEKERGEKAWIIGNVISFKKPEYKSPFFDTEEVRIIKK